ncbi:MAG: ABC transporter ATP-binding protein [Chitinispirillales bacterium]|nr:ABC transporter ATP-binding protein [Chitinispirillales bacterium]
MKKKKNGAGAGVKGSLVTIKNVEKSFGGFRALKGVSLEIKKGEFYSLLGPSGCGKTTLLRIIAGFEEPSAGAVLLDGRDMVPIPANRRPVNTIFQTYALFPHLTVFENVAFPLRLKKLPNATVKDKVQQFLELVKLPNEGKKLPAQLSGGQKQRVAIARALINEPSVLLLDEPLSALDAKLRQHMLIELDTIHDKIGITFIYVTHDQQEALSVSDRVAVMNEGEIVQIGTPFEIYESPTSPFVAHFIGETNYIIGAVTRLIDEVRVEIEFPEIGAVVAYRDKPLSVGDSVKMTIRPEKIRISTELPEGLSEKFNVLSGNVDEVIYSGFQSKFFVRMGERTMFRVFKQHVRYFMDEKAINWKDQVYIWWHYNDSFIVEVGET